MRIIAGVEREPDESQAFFFQRQASTIKKLREQNSCTVTRTICEALVRWVTHIHRHPQPILFKILCEQPESWLRERRQAHTTNVSTVTEFDDGSTETSLLQIGRPATRAAVGSVFRWAEGLLEVASEEVRGG